MQYGVQHSRSRGRSYRKFVGITIVCLVAAGLIFARWTSTSNQGQIVQDSDKKPAAQAVSDKVLNGKYVTLTYSGKYQAKNLPAKDTDLELYMLTADTDYNKTLAVTVSQLPGGDLNNDSAYLFRLSMPGTYTKSQIEVAGAPAVVWTKNDNFEETVFIPHGNTVAVLAFVTSVPSDKLDLEVTALLATFHWK